MGVPQTQQKAAGAGIKGASWEGQNCRQRRPDIQSVRRHKEGIFIASRVIAGTAIAGKITVCHQGACDGEVSHRWQSWTPKPATAGGLQQLSDIFQIGWNFIKYGILRGCRTSGSILTLSCTDDKIDR